MSVSINGSTGISGVNGSASNPAIKGGDADTGIHFGSDTAAITTGGTDKVSIDSSGDTTFSGKVKTSKVENANTSNGGVEIDTDGHVQVDGRQLPTAGPQANRNILFNGEGLVIQRGTQTGISSNSHVYGTDRWALEATPASTGTFTFGATTSVLPPGGGFQAAHRILCTTASTGLAANAVLIFQQRLEGVDMQRIKKGTANAEPLVLSFYVRSSKTGTYIVEFQDANNGRNIQRSYTITTADTYQYVELTIPGDTTNALSNNTGHGFTIRFWLVAGSVFQSGTLQTTWGNTVNANRVVGQVNLADTVNADWYVTGIQLELGTKATPYEQKTFRDELSRCQRYFQLVPFTNGVVATATQVHANYSLMTEMRAAPSVSQQGIFDVNDNSVNATQSGVNVISYGDGKIKFVQIGSFTGLTTHRPCFMRFSGDPSNNNLLTLNAEL